MREIIFDTETTGLDPDEDRIIEIGCVEMENRVPTGRTFHVYINPQGKQIPPGAFAIHGISNEQLADKPAFPEIVRDFLTFIDDAVLVAHNAGFDIGFINAELVRCGYPPIRDEARIVDTLALARRKHPVSSNTLDALCKRYGIDNSRRTFHGALLDSRILADVYIELLGGKQGALGFYNTTDNPYTDGLEKDIRKGETKTGKSKKRPAPLSSRITEKEQAAHLELLKKIGDKSLWYRRNHPSLQK